MNTKTRIAQLIALATATSVAQAETFTVGPSFTDFDFITITAAIAASSDGDVIEIQPGLYPENLEIVNFDLTLRNAGGGTVTVFGQGLDKCLRISGPGADEVVIEGITFSNGFSTSAGGGVSVEGSASATITDCIIENSSSDTGGGGFYVSGGVVMSDTIIRDNTSTGDGGGILIFSGSFDRIFTNVTIEGNTGVEGGGMAYVTSSDTADFVDCRFIGNRATSRGGAIAVLGTGLTGIVDVENTVFESNSAVRAGAIWVSDQDIFRATNSLFVNNSADTLGGVCRNEEIFEAINCTFVNNAAGDEPSNDSFESNRTDAQTRLLNCIVINDSAGSFSGIGNFVPSYSLIPEAGAGPADSNGNFNADPMFVDALMGDYRLMAASPAIDAGNSRGVLGGIDVLDILTDLNGNVRNLDDTDTSNTGVSTWELCVDLGAYEFQPVVEPDCIADITDDGILDFFDVSAFLSAFGDGCPE